MAIVDIPDFIECAGVLAPRGWSTRHGRRGRLAVPPRAADNSEGIVCRGRSVFKRSANKGTSWRPQMTVDKKPTRAALWDTSEDVLFASELLAHTDSYGVCVENEEVEVSAWNLGEDEEEVDEEEEGGAYVWDGREAPEDACSTCPSTTASSELCPDRELKEIQAGLPLQGLSPREIKVGLSPWDLAVRRAELGAERYFAQRAGTAKSQDCQTSRRRCRVQSRRPLSGFQALVHQLRKDCGADVKYNPERQTQKVESRFEQLRQQFFEQHAPAFCSGLQKCFGGPFQVRATPLSSDVSKVLPMACQELEGNLCPAFHGTHDRNLDSIYRQGLVIPGHGNDVKVTNGSVYGLGVYTAVVSAPLLSWSYARGTMPMLVCGVLDSASEEEVRHTGNAMVIFDSRRIAPLFEATRAGSLPPRRAAPAHVALPGPQHPRLRRVSQKAKIVLAGAARFLARRAARKRCGPSDLSSACLAV